MVVKAKMGNPEIVIVCMVAIYYNYALKIGSIDN